MEAPTITESYAAEILEKEAAICLINLQFTQDIDYYLKKISRWSWENL